MSKSKKILTIIALSIIIILNILYILYFFFWQNKEEKKEVPQNGLTEEKRAEIIKELNVVPKEKPTTVKTRAQIIKELNINTTNAKPLTDVERDAIISSLNQ